MRVREDRRGEERTRKRRRSERRLEDADEKEERNRPDHFLNNTLNRN